MEPALIISVSGLCQGVVLLLCGQRRTTVRTAGAQLFLNGRTVVLRLSHNFVMVSPIL